MRAMIKRKEWLGSIPVNWGYIPGKYVFRLRTTKGNNTPVLLAATQKQGMYPQHLLEGVVQVREGTDMQSFRTVHKDDYVISLRSFQGGFEMSDYEGVCSPAYQVFYNTKPIDHRYYKYLFKSKGFIQEMDSVTVGIREGKNIPYDSFAQTYIPYPSPAEQSRISAFLDERCAKIDEAIAQHDALIKKLDEYRKALITDAVTKGVRGKREMKETGSAWIDAIPYDWEFKRFKFIANNLFKGNGITKDQVFLDGDMPCVRYGEIYSKYDGAFDKCISMTRLDIQEAPRFFKQGDILFAGTGELIEEIGKNIIYIGDGQCLAGGDIIVARHKQNGVFLNYALNSSYAQAQKSYGKAKLKVVHISASEIGDVLVALPPKDEQAEIADYLNEKCAAIDATKERHAQLMTKLEEYKKSLIYYAVTGKIEC